MPKLISWTTKDDGTLEESDMRFFPCEDGTYEIESTLTALGFILGLDPVSKKFTSILDIVDKKKIQRIKSVINVGDILVSVNDRIVLEEPFNSVVALMELLIKGGYKRRLKFLNPKKCSIAVYLQKLELAGKLSTDMLGFNCSFEYKLDERAFRAATFSTTNLRDQEWVEYLKSIGGPENLKPAGVFKPSADLKAIVRRGIPVAFRATVWQRVSLSSVYRNSFPADYYQTLLGRVEAELNPKVMNDIEKDVDRTFPEHTYFEPEGQGEDSLRRVLQAFALHNPDVGYCQSLNFVTGMMLIFMQEEDAFWLLVTIVEKLLPPDYYTKSMVGTYVDQFVLAHIIKKCLPRIHNTFEANQLQLPLITVQWFMCLFVNTLRPEVTLRVWDMFLNEGSKVLFRIAAALFKLHESALLQVKDAADLFSALRVIGKDIVDADVLIAAAYKNYGKQRNLKTTKARHSKSQILEGFANPRLKTVNSMFGMVPKEISGIGLAHVGPVKTAAPAVVAAATRVEGASSPVDLNSVASSSADETGGASSAVSDSESSAPSTPVKGGGSGGAKGSPSANIGELVNVDFGALNPSLHNSPGSLMPNTDRFSSEFLTPEKLKHRKSHAAKKNQAQRNGDFNFYRTDILLWRASFRPALEERHIKMEAARKNWSNKHTSSEHRGSLTPSTPAKVEVGGTSSAGHHLSVGSAGSARRPSNLASMSVDISVVGEVIPEGHSPLTPHASSGSMKQSPRRYEESAAQFVKSHRSESVTAIGYMESVIPLNYNIDFEFAAESVEEVEADQVLSPVEEESSVTEDVDPIDPLDLEINGSIIPSMRRSSATKGSP